MLKKYTISKAKEVNLDNFDPEDTDRFTDKSEVTDEFMEMEDTLRDYQEKLFASKTHSVLILFQGMDCSGKDGVIKKVLSILNPQGFRAESFKRPTEEEGAHDFLWRAHKVTPAKGYITAFNRSYYEDVLITKVHKTITDEEADKRMEQIRHFENMLSDNGVLLIKIFLNISKSFQKEKINERLTNPDKHWKFDPSDLQEREYWDHYIRAYEDVFSKTSGEEVPWHIVPANHRWFRDYLVLKVIVSSMEKLSLSYPKVSIDPHLLLEK